MRTVAFKLVGNWLLTVYGTMTPSDQDWNICAKAFKEMPIEGLKILIYSKGGVPTAAQRKLMNDVLDGRAPITALVSSSAVARGVATAMSWFNRRIKAFPMDHLKEAFHYLEIPPQQHEDFEREVARMAADVGSEVGAVK